MSDILGEAKALADGLADCPDFSDEQQMMRQLVTEIERLREPPQEPDWIADWKAIENGLSVSAKKWMIAYQKAQNSWIVRQKQNKALEEMLSAKESLNNDLMANCNQLRDRCWKAEGNLARWQKIAIDEKAKQMDGPCQFRTSYEWCDDRQASCDGFPHMWECCPNKDHWRSEAAKELNLWVTQESDYIAILEEAWIVADGNILSLHRDGLRLDQVSEEKRQRYRAEAQAALTKIREDKP